MKIALYSFVFMSLFYFGFLAYASVVNRGGWLKLTIEGKIFTAVPFIAFLLLDVSFNWTLADLLFLQPATLKTWTLSKRMASNIATQPTSWRGKLSAIIVSRDLLPFTKNY